MGTMNKENPYITASRGSFKGIRHWHELDSFWQLLETLNDGKWFVYDTNREPPNMPVGVDEFSHFIQKTNTLLHEQHQEEYCGIVYVDNIDNPEYIKIYDPANLGVACGYSDNPPLPGWILSRLAACSLHVEKPVSRWKKYLHRFT